MGGAVANGVCGAASSMGDAKNVVGLDGAGAICSTGCDAGGGGNGGRLGSSGSVFPVSTAGAATSLAAAGA